MDTHHYLIRGGSAGAERMRVVGSVLRPTTLSVLERAGVAGGMRCLDVGCGAGEVTLDLASLVGPSGHVVGIDIDEGKIELGRAEAARAGLANVEFRVVDLADGVAEGAYDVVYARCLLTHLPDPAAGLALMKAGLGSSGRLIVEDIDYGGSFCHPESEDFGEYSRIYERTAELNGGDPFIGVKLPRMMLDAGFQEVHPTIAHPAGLEGGIKLIPALTLQNIRAMAIRHGVATGAEVDGLVDRLNELAEDRTSYVGLPRIVQVWGRLL